MRYLCKMNKRTVALFVVLTSVTLWTVMMFMMITQLVPVSGAMVAIMASVGVLLVVQLKTVL